MPLLNRPFTPADFPSMATLIHDFPEGTLHVVDLPYRLSSWTFDYPENTQLWFNPEGELLAWASLQVPFWTIDYAYRPDTEYDLHRTILDWADQQARKLLNTASGHPAWYVTVFPHQTDRIRDLEELGFASQANVGDNSRSQVLMQHDPT
jgi:hypothetical protein